MESERVMGESARAAASTQAELLGPEAAEAAEAARDCLRRLVRLVHWHCSRWA